MQKTAGQITDIVLEKLANEAAELQALQQQQQQAQARKEPAAPLAQQAVAKQDAAPAPIPQPQSQPQKIMMSRENLLSQLQGIPNRSPQLQSMIDGINADQGRTEYDVSALYEGRNPDDYIQQPGTQQLPVQYPTYSEAPYQNKSAAYESGVKLAHEQFGVKTAFLGRVAQGAKGAFNFMTKGRNVTLPAAEAATKAAPAAKQGIGALAKKWGQRGAMAAGAGAIGAGAYQAGKAQGMNQAQQGPMQPRQMYSQTY